MEKILSSSRHPFSLFALCSHFGKVRMGAKSHLEFQKQERNDHEVARNSERDDKWSCE